MVQITGWQKRQKENGESFNVLILQGGIEMIKSSATGKFYATARKTNLICTLSDSKHHIYPKLETISQTENQRHN